MVLIQSTVGLPTSAANAASPSLRGEPTGGLVDQPAHLQFVEPCRVGALYTASIINTGVTMASLTLTTSAPTALYNPAGSGVNVFLKSLTLGYVSGTYGAGQLFLVGHIGGAATTGTACTYINNALIGNTTIPHALPTYTSTVPTGGKVIQNLWTTDAFVGSVTGPPFELKADFNGSIGIMPANGVSLQGITAAGTSPVAVFTWVWEEVAIAT